MGQWEGHEVICVSDLSAVGGTSGWRLENVFIYSQFEANHPRYSINRRSAMAKYITQCSSHLSLLCCILEWIQQYLLQMWTWQINTSLYISDINLDPHTGNSLKWTYMLDTDAFTHCSCMLPVITGPTFQDTQIYRSFQLQGELWWIFFLLYLI